MYILQCNKYMWVVHQNSTATEQGWPSAPHTTPSNPLFYMRCRCSPSSASTETGNKHCLLWILQELWCPHTRSKAWNQPGIKSYLMFSLGREGRRCRPRWRHRCRAREGGEIVRRIIWNIWPHYMICNISLRYTIWLSHLWHVIST